MAQQLFVDGQPLNYNSAALVGNGNEATVVDLGGGLAGKLYKLPNHPDFDGLPLEQKGARERLAEHQTKLKAFPTGLLPNVVAPKQLITDKKNQVVGYTMTLVKGAHILMKYSEESFRSGVKFPVIKSALLNLYDTVAHTHKQQVIIGDFNDRNVLVTPDGKVWMVDADSWQFKTWLCRLFTAKFLDPLISEPDKLMLDKPHNVGSDWYAYASMVYEALTMIDIFGGQHKPASGVKRVKSYSDRVLQCLPVWSPDVLIPDFVLSHIVLPDDIMHHFDQMVKGKERKPIPRYMLESLEERSCDQTGKVHYRKVSPYVAGAAPAASVEKTTVTGNLIAKRIFLTTSGRILFATSVNGVMQYVYQEGSKYFREGGIPLLLDKTTPDQRLRISGKRTLVGDDHRLTVYERTPSPKFVTTDTFGSTPVMAANSLHYYWTNGDQLFRDDNAYYGVKDRELLGPVMSGLTQIWVGEKFGFGFYRLGDSTQAFIFDAERPNSVKMVQHMPGIRGQLLDASATFSNQQCWFTTVTQEGSETIHRCLMISAAGEVIAQHVVTKGDDDWLGSTIRGFAANQQTLFVPTADGIMSVKLDGSTLKVKSFPDTHKFVSPGTYLFIGSDGLYATNTREVYLLQMK